jgi:hypothetical protein
MKLTAATRRKIPTESFAGPDRSFPVQDKAHARNALARSSGKPIEAQIRAKVEKKFPTIGEKKKGAVARGAKLDKWMKGK